MHVRFCTFLLALAAAMPAFADTGRADTISGECSGSVPSFGLVRQTESIPTPAPQAEGYIYGSGYENAEPPGSPLLTWADAFGADFPSRSRNGMVRVANGKFVALEFRTDAQGAPIYGGNNAGAVNVALAPEWPGLHVYSIARCPGDFSNAPALPTFCRSGSPDATLSWRITDQPAQFTCVLQEHTTYYLNIAFVDTNSGAATCTGGPLDSCNFFAETR